MRLIQDICDALDEADIAIIYAYANNKMRTQLAAKSAHYDRRTVSERLTNIRLKTSIDPRDFWGLHRLISIIETGRGKGVD